jgi:hypothetical protein
MFSKILMIKNKFNFYLNPLHWRIFLLRIRLKEFYLKRRLEYALNWFFIAQKKSGSIGISYGYAFDKGWFKAYPETNGYIISTLIDYYKISNEVKWMNFALEIGDWEIAIQKPDGSVRVGFPEKEMSDIFDTGMVLEGFVQLYKTTGLMRFLIAAKKATNWLINSMNSQGAWDTFTFQNIPHTYHTLVAQAILSLYKYDPDERYLYAVDKNLSWVFLQKQSNGWFKYQGFSLYEDPYTHTMAYFIQGMLKLYKENYQNRYDYLLPEIEEYCLRLIGQFSLDKLSNTDLLLLPGQIKPDWTSNYNYTCLTGNAQFSVIFFDLYKITKNFRYLFAAENLLSIVASSQVTSYKKSKFFGAIPGSYPLNGHYHPFEFPNWPVKFFADAIIRKLCQPYDICSITA